MRSVTKLLPPECFGYFCEIQSSIGEKKIVQRSIQVEKWSLWFLVYKHKSKAAGSRRKEMYEFRIHWFMSFNSIKDWALYTCQLMFWVFERWFLIAIIVLDKRKKIIGLMMWCAITDFKTQWQLFIFKNIFEKLTAIIFFQPLVSIISTSTFWSTI